MEVNILEWQESIELWLAVYTCKVTSRSKDVECESGLEVVPCLLQYYSTSGCHNHINVYRVGAVVP